MKWGTQLLSDGTFWYDYDPEGNRTLRYVWTDADSDGEVDEGERSQITEYEWDHRNRLVRVTERESETGPATQVVEHTYDYLNRWVARSVDGDGPLGFVDTYFVYDGVPSGAVLLDRSAGTTSVSREAIESIVPLPSSVRSPSQASFRGTSARKPVGRTSPRRWLVLIRRLLAQ